MTKLGQERLGKAFEGTTPTPTQTEETLADREEAELGESR